MEAALLSDRELEREGDPEVPESDSEAAPVSVDRRHGVKPVGSLELDADSVLHNLDCVALLVEVDLEEIAVHRKARQRHVSQVVLDGELI